MMGPKFVAMAGEDQNKDVVFIKVDVDENAEASEAAGIECMPTFQFYKAGAKVDELRGADLEGLKAKVAALKWTNKGMS